MFEYFCHKVPSPKFQIQRKENLGIGIWGLEFGSWGLGLEITTY